MADYIFFAGGVPISDLESSNLDEELNVVGLTLDEESEVHFNNLNLELKSLAIASVSAMEVSKKRPRDEAPDEKELIEGSRGLFAKRPRIPGCLDMKKWPMKNKSPASLQDPDIRDHCAESLHFSPDVQRWAEYGKDDFPSAILGHILEVNTSCALSLFFLI